jgi:hypothetical protein
MIGSDAWESTMLYERSLAYLLMWCVGFCFGCDKNSECLSITNPTTDSDAYSADPTSGDSIEGDAGMDTNARADSDPETDEDTDAYVAGFDNRTPIEPSVTDEGGSGNVTTYGSVADPAPSEGGACNYGKTGIYSYAAISVNVSPGDDQGQWNDGRICGQCAEVWAETPSGVKTTVVRIVDKCPDAYCGIDLGGLPAQELMGRQAGRYDGGWKFVPCGGHDNVFDGPTAIYVKEGSNPYWSIIHVRNPPARVVSISWETDTDSGVLDWATEAENYFSVPEAVRNEAGAVRLTIVYDFDNTDTLVTTGTALTKGMALIPIP